MQGEGFLGTCVKVGDYVNFVPRIIGLVSPALRISLKSLSFLDGDFNR